MQYFELILFCLENQVSPKKHTQWAYFLYFYYKDSF